MMKFLKKNKKGFSLAELIVVIAILGILAAIVVPRVAENTDQARIAHDRATLRTVQGAVNMFHAQNGTFPTGTQSGATNVNYEGLGAQLTNFLDLAANDMPNARSRDAGNLRQFLYNPANGAVTAHPALPAVN